MLTTRGGMHAFVFDVSPQTQKLMRAQDGGLVQYSIESESREELVTESYSNKWEAITWSVQLPYQTFLWVDIFLDKFANVVFVQKCVI